MTPRNEHRETVQALRAMATARNLPFITVVRCFLRVVLDEYKRTGSLAELEKPDPEWIARVHSDVEASLNWRQQEWRRQVRIM